MRNAFTIQTLKGIKWLLVIVTLLFVCGVSAIFLMPQGWLQHIAGEKGSARFGRTFAIDGGIHIGWDWTTPYVHIGKVRMANRDGADQPNMVDIDEVNFHIKMWNLLKGELNLPDINLVKPRIVLEKAADGSKNWDLPALSKANAVTHAALPTKRSNFPLLGTLSIQEGTINYKDATENLDLTLSIDSAKGGGTDENGNFKLAGQGTLQGQPFKLDAEGGSLSMLRNSKADYPLDLHIAMGKTGVAVKGTFTDPVKVENIDAALDLHGDNMADLFYLTAIPLPPTPPYKLTGRLTKRGEIWTFEQFKGQVGQSDLGGHLVYDTSGNRDVAKAELNSNLLRVDDLSGFIGAKTDATGKQTQQTAPVKDQRLLPDMPINLSRLRATDMDVRFKAQHIEEPGWPLDNLDVRFDLKDGVLRLDPFSVGAAGGKISGPLIFDGSKDEPDVSSDLLLQKLSFKPFFSDSRFETFSNGHFGGRLQLEGHGRSLAAVLADSNGRVTLMMGGGTVSKLIVAAAGLDLGKAAPALLGKDQATVIRCAIGDFGVKEGLLNSNIFVFDTTASNIQGSANINLKDETIDAKIEAHPKETSITARTPITISGKLRKPSIGLDPKEITERAAAAAAISAVLTPLAGVIPFIEPGLGKDSDCRGLIDEAKAHSGTVPPQEPQQP